MDYIVHPGGHIKGTAVVPGDKSISHRALILGALAKGRTEIRGILNGSDCLATAKALRHLGVSISWDKTCVIIHGTGALSAPSEVLDFGNSGTSIRLFSGVLSAQRFSSQLTGDASLQKRPMSRVAKPLTQMGARIQTNDGKPPIRIEGVNGLTGIDYVMPMASAQVKSALLLAGLSAKGETRITEPAPTRDHTEKMLAGMGVCVRREGTAVSIKGPSSLSPLTIEIPGDFSSAAFPLVAAAMDPAGDLTINNVGVNPTRIGLLTAMQEMGATLEIVNRRKAGGEEVANIHVLGTRLRGITLDPTLVPLMIDEFPIFFIAAAVAEGETIVTGVQELRTKESDRLASMAAGLIALGISVETTADSITILGGRPTGGLIQSFGDHRVAMAFSVLGQQASGPITIAHVGNVATSFPGYHGLMKILGLSISLRNSL